LYECHKKLKQESASEVPRWHCITEKTRTVM
jgi:hypothetical protein